MIPMVDLKYQHKIIEIALRKRLDALFENCNFILGKEVAEFEEAFAKWTGQKHCISVASGTAALELIIRSLQLPSGTEVIVPVNTFYATASAVEWGGLKVRFVDCGDDYLIDLSQAEKALTNGAKAMIVVHLYGQMVDIVRAKELCDKHSAYLIEDSAQSHGAQRDGVRVGDLSLATGYSFFPGKNLGCYGDGGAITTNDNDLAANLRRLRWFGAEDKYTHITLGTNAKFDTIQALVLLEKLKYIDEWNEQREQIAQRYISNLEGSVILPIVHSKSKHVWHMFVVQIENRNKLIADYKDRIGFGVHYPKPLNQQAAFSSTGAFKKADKFAPKLISLPIHPGLTINKVDEISQAVLNHINGGFDVHS